MTTKTLIEYRQTQVLYDKKWRLFLSRAKLFKHIPFVTAVFGNGSMAVGNVTESSDFDVLIAAQQGRIFTARAFSIIFFGLFGWRRSKNDHRQSAKDKICLNHFVTPKTFHLTEEPNEFWRLLYSNLVPVYGDDKLIRQFFLANQALLKGEHAPVDLRHKYKKPSKFKLVIQSLLGGKLGDKLERKLQSLQVKRIEAGLPKSQNEAKVERVVLHGQDITNGTYSMAPLIKYSEVELQFHPDPTVIEIKRV